MRPCNWATWNSLILGSEAKCSFCFNTLLPAPPRQQCQSQADPMRGHGQRRSPQPGRAGRGGGSTTPVLRSGREAVVRGRAQGGGRGGAASPPLLLQVTMNLVTPDHRPALSCGPTAQKAAVTVTGRDSGRGAAGPCGLQGAELPGLCPGRGCRPSPPSQPEASPLPSAPAPSHKDPMTAWGLPDRTRQNRRGCVVAEVGGKGLPGQAELSRALRRVRSGSEPCRQTPKGPPTPHPGAG